MKLRESWPFIALAYSVCVCARAEEYFKSGKFAFEGSQNVRKTVREKKKYVDEVTRQVWNKFRQILRVDGHS